MNFSPNTIRKAQQILEYSLLGAIAGVVFQMVDEQFVDYNGPLLGLAMGAGFIKVEIFILSKFKKKFLRLPFLLSIFIKAIVYLIIIIYVWAIMSFIVGTLEGKTMEEFYESMFSIDLLIIVVYTLLFYVVLSFYAQINLLLGEGVLWKFLLGRYRKPVHENRIFMFLDMKSSTTIAEQLGLEKYYSLLNDFFSEITEPVRSTGAEVYQYVGDEVVFTWRTKEGLSNSNCIELFFKIGEQVSKKRRYYKKKYGLVPEFKAGLHYGEVISAQIGDIKREIVYNGDILNTCARIQEQCNVYDSKLLISGELLNELNTLNEYQVKKMDRVKLRGKVKELDLFSVVHATNPVSLTGEIQG